MQSTNRPSFSFIHLSVKKQTLFCLLFLSALHATFYFRTGLYQCRYSLFEDYEIIANTAKIKQTGVLTAFVEQMRYETQGRFRPIYIAYRLSTCYFFGSTIQWHHHFLYAVFVLNTLLLFWWSRVFGFSPLLSLLFTLMVFTGAQTSVGWRLASGECFALLFLNVGMLCFSYSLKKRQRWLALVAGIFVMLAAFSKESFIFCYGLFPLLYLDRPVGQQVQWKKFWAICGVGILCVGLYILCVRFFLISPDAMKYAGSGISINDILALQFGMSVPKAFAINFSRIWQTFIFQGSSFQPYILLLGFGSIAAWLFTPFRKVIVWSVVIALTLLIMHKLLYLRIVLFKIYLFPALVAIVFLIIQWLHVLLISSKKIAAGSLLFASIFVLANQGRLSYTLAREVYSENLAAVSLTNALAAHCNNNPIYVQADPLLHVEFIYGMKARLNALGCHAEFLYSPTEEGDTTEALDIMRMTDPSLIPFEREQFYKQFSKKITTHKPETSLDGKSVWIIIQRAGRIPPRFKEIEQRLYAQQIYKTAFYMISTLIPMANSEKAL